MCLNCVEMSDSLLSADFETWQQLEPSHFCFVLLCDEETICNYSHKYSGSHICILVTPM